MIRLLTLYRTSFDRALFTYSLSVLIATISLVYGSIESVGVSKTYGDDIKIVIQQNPVDLVHTRVMIDLDSDHGTGFGEHGIDYMVEGASLYKYPENATGWEWELVEVLQVSILDDTLTYHVDGLTKFKVMRMFIELFDGSWATIERYPENNAISVDYDQLKSDSDSSGGLFAKMYKVGNKAFGLEVNGEDLVAERMRIFINTDGDLDTGFSNNGAEYLIEGSTLYQYTGSGSEWDWSVLQVISPNDMQGSLFYRLDDINLGSTIEYSVEKTSDSWEVIERFPEQGNRRIQRDGLKEYSYLDTAHTIEPKLYDIDELIARIPDSLSVNFSKKFGFSWVDAELIQPVWKPEGSDNSWALRIELTDASTEETSVLSPSHMMRAGEWVKWLGRIDGIDWELVGKISGSSILDLYMNLHSEQERVLRLSIGLEIPMVGWTWHDDVQFSREMDTGFGEYAYVGNSPYGMDGSASKYPFGVISRDNQSIRVETDMSEPRVFVISANPDDEFFGIRYDFALTPKTSKFSGSAAFHVTLQSDSPGSSNAFRVALTDFYERQPLMYERRPEVVGLWMPFTDMSTIPSAEDFGFAYYEKGGAIGQDVDYCHENGILTLAYTEPWLYWLPMPAGLERTPEAALRLMHRLSANGWDKANEFASGGVLGAARDMDNDIQMTFQNVPWNSGARMEVSTDPELPTLAGAPVNRAMAEFAFMTELMEDKRVDGIYLDSISAMFIMDYNPEAMAITEYPATFTSKDLTPGLATPIAAYEFMASLGAYVQDNGKYLMGNFPCWNFPFFMPFIDIPGEETHWFHEGHYERMTDKELNYRRAMSGKKAWGFLLNGKYDHFEPEYAQRYFEDCLYWAFQPSLFSHDAANDPYWENAEWYERDRTWFQRYMPWIQRLAMVGWSPMGPASTETQGIQMEHFMGVGEKGIFVTIRNDSDSPKLASIRLDLPETNTDWVVMNPLDANAAWLYKDTDGIASECLYILPEQVRFLSIIPVEYIPEEIEFLKSWKDGEGRATQLVSILESIEQQQELGVRLALDLPQPAIRGVEQELMMNISTNDENSLLENVFVQTQDDKTIVLDTPSSILKGKDLQVPIILPADFDSDSFSVRTELNIDGKLAAITLPVVWSRLNPVVASMEDGTIISIQEYANIPLHLTSLMNEDVTVSYKWSGDFGDGKADVAIEKGTDRTIYIPIQSNGVTHGQVQLRVEALGIELLKADVALQYLNQQASFVRDSSVKIETSSDFPGYSSKPLRDGVTQPTESIAFNEAAWASDESTGDHWIRFFFTQPTEVSEVKIFWNHEGGVTYTSREGSIRGKTPSGHSQLIKRFQNEAVTDVTTVAFEPVLLSSLEIRQPSRGGPEERPNLIWLTEIEVR